MPGCTAYACTPRSRETTVELHREQDVGGLRLAVRGELVVLAPLVVGIVPHDVGSPVPARAEVDDARRRIGEQHRHQQVGQQEVPDVVGAELHLEAFDGAFERRVHHARVVDQQVQPVVRRPSTTAANARTLSSDARSSEPASSSASGTWSRTVADGGVDARRVATREHHVGAGRRERARRLQTEPGRRAGDDRDLAAADPHRRALQSVVVSKLMITCPLRPVGPVRDHPAATTPDPAAPGTPSRPRGRRRCPSGGGAARSRAGRPRAVELEALPEQPLAERDRQRRGVHRDVTCHRPTRPASTSSLGRQRLATPEPLHLVAVERAHR